MSRLTRDSAELIRLGQRLRLRDIELVGVSDGISTGRPGGKLTLAFKGLVNELFLDDLADKTRRGLAGQVSRGLSPGGRCFGYRAVPVREASGPGHRKSPAEIEIHPPDAEVVREKIFRLYAAGQSMKAIARTLNRAGIPAPTSGRGARHGWGASTIDKMLRNARYAGIWTWNQTRWVKDPDTGRRRSIARPSTEWIRQERPELRIIEEPLWRAVQDRLRFVREAFGCAEPGRRPRGRAAAAYSPCLLSGLIMCGVCGANLVGQSYGTGVARRPMYRCGAAAAKGVGGLHPRHGLPASAARGGPGGEVPDRHDAGPHRAAHRAGAGQCRCPRRLAGRARRYDQGRDRAARARSG